MLFSTQKLEQCQWSYKLSPSFNACPSKTKNFLSICTQICQRANYIHDLHMLLESFSASSYTFLFLKGAFEIKFPWNFDYCTLYHLFWVQGISWISWFGVSEYTSSQYLDFLFFCLVVSLVNVASLWIWQIQLCYFTECMMDCQWSTSINYNCSNVLLHQNLT